MGPTSTRRRPSRWRAVRRGRPSDRWAVAFLVALPVLLYVPWSVAGAPVVPGDDLLQNLPLRVLSGQLIASGHLPAWDPFIWSGTPLLAGWNAGAMFPGTWLFALLSPVTAWTATLVAVGAVCGTGTYVLLRRLGPRPVPSLLGALVFTYTGFMSGQVVHIGLVQGTAFLPWTVVAVDSVLCASSRRSCRGGEHGHRLLSVDQLRPAGALAVVAALTVLAGDPRAVSTAGFVVAIQVGAACWRSRPDVVRSVVALGLATALGAAVSAVQWLPGLRFVYASQRGISAYNFFGGGSLSPAAIGSALTMPFLTGGNGNFGQPAYFGNYNLPETTIGCGLVALVAACAFLPEIVQSMGNWTLRSARAVTSLGGGIRERRLGASSRVALQYGPPTPTGLRLGVWYVTGAVGVLLTLGTDTPLGHVLVRLPLYGGERLQNRNAVMLDLALAVLLTFFVDDVTWSGWGRLLGTLPLLAVGALVVYAFSEPVALQQSLGVLAPDPRVFDSMAPYLVSSAATAMAIALLLALWQRVPRRVREVALVALVLGDVVTYLANTTYATASGEVLARATPDSTALASTMAAGRFALFNPNYYPTLGSQPDAVAEIGVTDLNILRDLPTVQGYGSIVQGSYSAATGTHQFEALDPSGLSGTTFDTLDLRSLLTLPAYLDEAIPPHSAIPVADGELVTISGARAKGAVSPPLPFAASGPWTLAPGGSSSWWLASAATIVRATVVLQPQLGGRPRVVDVGIGSPEGAVTEHRVAVVNGVAELKLLAAARAVRLVVTDPARGTAVVGAVVAVTRAPDERLLLDGELQGVLQAPHWAYARSIGPFTVFANRRARGLAWLESAMSRSPDGRRAPGSVAAGLTTGTGAQSMRVTTTSASLLVRSVTYAPGWTASISTAGRRSIEIERARQVGLDQAVEVPAGTSTVVWRYTPGSDGLGLDLSLAGSALVGLFLEAAALSGRRARRRPSPETRQQQAHARRIRKARSASIARPVT